MIDLRVIHLQGVSILEQLYLEEALLRTSKENFCIFNSGVSPAIVMGISGSAEDLIHMEKKPPSLPLIKRYSGGGTVVIDQNTLFVSFIFNKETHSFPLYPNNLYTWSESVYQKAFAETFALHQNDYVFKQGDGTLKKFGGNAQYIQKDRWVHHTTLLWKYSEELMSLLKLPKKQPGYREMRSHEDFLCSLYTSFTEKKAVFTALERALAENYTLIPTSYEEVQKQINIPHRRSTKAY